VKFMKLLKSLTVRLLLLLIFLLTIVGPPAAQAEPGRPAAKYVFLFIGDGLGLAQRTLAEWFLAETQGRTPEQVRLTMSSFPVQGLTATHAADRWITDSAAAATALATGYKTKVGLIGMDQDLKPRPTIAEKAKARGLKVGLISPGPLDDATPACFYAHRPSRRMYHEIGHDLVRSGFDLFAGGGFRDPTGLQSPQPLGDVLAAARSAGYTLVSDKKAWLNLKAGSGRIIAGNERLEEEGVPLSLDRSPEDISLAEFTLKAMELLDNPAGFFLMVEGAAIDWACHANDGRTAIEETLDFDRAVAEAVKFFNRRPRNTLIVVTGDHECGGLALGGRATKNDTHLKVLTAQKISFQAFESAMADFRAARTPFETAAGFVEENIGLKLAELTAHDREKLLQTYHLDQEPAEGQFPQKTGSAGHRRDPFVRLVIGLLNQQAGLGWASYGHTGAPVVTSALGRGAELFGGWYDNTELARKIMSAMGLAQADSTRPRRGDSVVSEPDRAVGGRVSP